MSYSKQVSALAGSASALSPTLRRIVGDSAERAADKLVGRSADSAAVFRDELRHLSSLVCSMAAAGKDAKTEGASPTFSPDLVDVLRVEFLSQLNQATDKRVSVKEILGVLLAMESVSGGDGQRETLDSAARPMSADALNGMLEIAHDMRSPLGAILLLVEPIRKGHHGPVTPVQERQLGLIYGAALSLTSLANDVIDAARGDCLGNAARHPFSISATMEDACAVVRPIAEEQELELSQTYPAGDGRVGDASAIHRVLLNLASNALKYTDRGSVAVGCTELDDTRVEFWVKDTGRGIPDHVLAHLFDEFRPGPIGSRFFSAGLGLTICRRLLKSMNSTLRVETELEKGTRFSFVLDLPRTETEPSAN